MQSRQQDAENKYAKPFAAPKFKSICTFLQLSQQPIEGIFQFLAEKLWNIRMETQKHRLKLYASPSS